MRGAQGPRGGGHHLHGEGKGATEEVAWSGCWGLFPAGARDSGKGIGTDEVLHVQEMACGPERWKHGVSDRKCREAGRMYPSRGGDDS